MTRWHLLVIVLVGVGLTLRSWNLGGPALDRDEAESAINALTILQHGVPTDRYLNLPMFENTLTQSWPESLEYEFKDTSYSGKGLAIYHGWVPLYAIAASFAILGVRPDEYSEPPRVLHGSGEMRRRALAARAPSIVFAAIFLLALIATGRAIYGEPAGLLALAIGTFTPYLIDAARQARYYSAALAIGTLGILCLWQVLRRGSWRDFLAAGGVFVMLFHTNIPTFAFLLLAATLILPVMLKRSGGGSKVAAAGTIIAAGVLPWMWMTGFLDGARNVPMAYSLLRFPQDFLFYAGQRPEMPLLMVAAVAEFAVAMVLRGRLPVRLVEPLRAAGVAVGFLVGLMFLANLTFFFLTPAASFFKGRMTLVLIAPAVLLVSVLLAANTRVLGARYQGILVAVLVLIGVAASSRAWMPKPGSDDARLIEILDHLQSQKLGAGTRIYALPYDHFRLTFYAGMPVQSIAPVRKQFLDGYKGNVLIVERIVKYAAISKEVVKERALTAGKKLDADAIQKWQAELSVRPALEHVAASVKVVEPPLRPLPAWAALTLEECRRKSASTGGGTDWADENPAIFRGYHVTDMVRFWPVFFYRFVDPEGRSGPRLNYAARIRAARARVLNAWVIYQCDAPGEVSAVAQLRSTKRNKKT